MDHEKPYFPFAEEGGGCWCGGSGTLALEPNGGICNCGSPNTMPPCWNCQHATLICDECHCEIDEVDWPMIAGVEKVDTTPKEGDLFHGMSAEQIDKIFGLKEGGS